MAVQAGEAQHPGWGWVPQWSQSGTENLEDSWRAAVDSVHIGRSNFFLLVKDGSSRNRIDAFTSQEWRQSGKNSSDFPSDSSSCLSGTHSLPAFKLWLISPLSLSYLKRVTFKTIIYCTFTKYKVQVQRPRICVSEQGERKACIGPWMMGVKPEALEGLCTELAQGMNGVIVPSWD